MNDPIPLPTSQDPDGLPPELLVKLRGMPPLNVLWMLARTGWLDQILAALAVMFDPKDFPPRDREVMMLRIAAFLHVDYPIPQHRVFGRTAGMTDQEMQAVIDRADQELDPWTIQLCRICEEISERVTLSEASVQRLVDHYGRGGATQAIWLMSWFNMLTRFVASTRVPTESPALLAAALGGPTG